tara:strand:- start:23 stop:391 length:369 start_codon:yes stop_codon:yes gene_type:complete
MKNKRKAIDCKLIEASQSSPGYFKYLVTIKEKDGNIHEVPCYGYDMQDAIRRLINVERAEKIVNVVSKGPDWIIIMIWFTLLGVPSILANIYNNQDIETYGIIGIFASIITLALYYNRVSKK